MRQASRRGRPPSSSPAAHLQTWREREWPHAKPFPAYFEASANYQRLYAHIDIVLKGAGKTPPHEKTIEAAFAGRPVGRQVVEKIAFALAEIYPSFGKAKYDGVSNELAPPVSVGSRTSMSSEADDESGAIRHPTVLRSLNPRRPEQVGHAVMFDEEATHNEAFNELREELAVIGLDLEEHIPRRWRDCVERASDTTAAVRRWRSTVRLMAPIFSTSTRQDPRAVLEDLVGLEVVAEIPRNVETRIREAVHSLPSHRIPERSRLEAVLGVRFGDVFGLAEARVKKPSGVLRRSILKGSNVATVDALAAWIIVEPEMSADGPRVPGDLIRHLEGLQYKRVGKLDTPATSAAYDALTFTREKAAAGPRPAIGNEVKVFTCEQFRNAEVDPCSDSARSRYERRRLLELAKALGFPGTTVHFVRHGRTEGNANNILHGWSDSPVLSDQDRATEDAADRFSADLAGGTPKIYSSDLRRALVTAQHFSKRFGSNPIPLPGLRERHLGEFQGMSRPSGEEGNRFFERFGADQPVPGGESFQAMAARVIVTVLMAIDAGQDSEIMLVTHAGPLRALLGGIDGVPTKLQWDLPSHPHLWRESRFIPNSYLSRVFGSLYGLPRLVDSGS